MVWICKTKQKWGHNSSTMKKERVNFYIHNIKSKRNLKRIGIFNSIGMSIFVLVITTYVTRGINYKMKFLYP